MAMWSDSKMGGGEGEVTRTRDKGGELAEGHGELDSTGSGGRAGGGRWTTRGGGRWWGGTNVSLGVCRGDARDRMRHKGELAGGVSGG